MRLLGTVGAVGPRSAVVAAGVAWIVLGPMAMPSGFAQRPAPAPARPQPADDLSTRYRLIEQYTTTPEKAPPEAINQYRVAFKEATKTTLERAGAEPERIEFGLQAIYTERPAEISVVDERSVTSLVRRYERVRSSPDTRLKGVGPSLFDGLTIWYQNRPGDEPLVLNLTPGRPLTDEEYGVTRRVMFVPNLAYLLPDADVRVTGTWAISGEGEAALVGPAVKRGGLTGKLLEVRAAESGPGRVAVIEVAGRLMVTLGDDPASAALRARLDFAFNAPADAKADAEKGEEAVVEARGAIVRVGLAQITVSEHPAEADGRARTKRTDRFDLVLERRPGNEGGPLTVPTEPPQPTPENSWLTYTDRQGRFSFRHPQRLGFFPDSDRDPNTLQLGRMEPGSEAMIYLNFVPAEEIKADAFFKDVFDKRRKTGQDLTVGQASELPAADWGGNRVVKAEAVAPVGNGPAETVFAYVIHFARQKATLAVDASTMQESPKSFRAEVEEILKSFRLGKAVEGPQ